MDYDEKIVVGTEVDTSGLENGLRRIEEILSKQTLPDSSLSAKLGDMLGISADIGTITASIEGLASAIGTASKAQEILNGAIAIFSSGGGVIVGTLGILAGVATVTTQALNKQFDAMVDTKIYDNQGLAITGLVDKLKNSASAYMENSGRIRMFCAV